MPCSPGQGAGRLQLDNSHRKKTSCTAGLTICPDQGTPHISQQVSSSFQKKTKLMSQSGNPGRGDSGEISAPLKSRAKSPVASFRARISLSVCQETDMGQIAGVPIAHAI